MLYLLRNDRGTLALLFTVYLNSADLLIVGRLLLGRCTSLYKPSVVNGRDFIILQLTAVLLRTDLIWYR